MPPPARPCAPLASALTLPAAAAQRSPARAGPVRNPDPETNSNPDPRQGCHGMLIELLQIDAKFHTAVEVAAGNQLFQVVSA